MSKRKFETFEESLQKGDLDGVRNNFEKYFLEKIIDDDLKRNLRPIHWACLNGHVNIAKFLINQKCNIESEDKRKMRPIHFACENGSVEMVKLLIDQRCNIESENDWKWRPIHFVCRNGSVEMLKVLIDQRCNLESETEGKWRPIHYACYWGYFEKVKLLFAHGCQIDVKDEDGQTPLEVARSEGRNEIVKWIERFIKKNSELCESISNNDLKAFIKHYSSDTSMILSTKSGTPWLEMALKNRADKFFKFFIDQPIHPRDIVVMRNVVDEDITQSLNYQLYEEVLLYKCIRDHNLKGFMMPCRPNVINRQRKLIPCSFLEAAAEHGAFVFVDEILKKSAFDVESWKRAKVMALEKGHTEIAESISIRESLLKCRQKTDLSILHTAVCDNDPEMVEYILRDGNLVDPIHNHEIR